MLPPNCLALLLEPPEELKVIPGSETAQSFRIQWEMPVSQVSGVESYRLELKSTSSSGSETTEYQTIEQSSPCTSSCSATIINLRPDTEYNIQLSAVNSAGPSILSKPKQTVRTLASVPDAVSNIEVSAAASGSSFDVSWDLPTANGASLDNITVVVCDKAAGAPCVTSVEAPDAVSTSVGGLTAGRNYTVTVEAANAIGFSGRTFAAGQSASYDFYTTPSVPDMGYAPYLATPPLTGLDPKTSLHVMWLAPFDNTVEITQYKLMVDGMVFEVDASSGIDQYVYSGLIPGTTHNFSVAAENSLGLGDWSPTVEFTTNASVPGMPITKPTLAVSNATMIKLSLSPAAYTGGFDVERYEVFCDAGEPLPSCNGTVQVPDGSMELVVPDRRLDLTYVFKSRAVNSAGRGPWSE